MLYINWKNCGYTETVDECKTKEAARYLRGEYQAAYGEGHVYISTKPTKWWRGKK